MKMNILILILVVLLCYSILPTYGYKLKNYLQKRTSSKKVLYLTFDDGPHEKYTEQLLDLLQDYGVKVTFFSVARFAEENHEIINRMKAEGHTIGGHSLEHKSDLWKPLKNTMFDFRKSMEIMQNLGVHVKFFRPPWGHRNIGTIFAVKKYRLKIVLWNVMVGDWKANITYETMAEKLLNRVQSGDIVCLHDGRGKEDAPSRMIEALKQVLPEWISQGYSFDTVEHLYE